MTFKRIVIEAVAPAIDGGGYPAKAIVGEHVPVRAVVWRDGHAPVTVVTTWISPEGTRRTAPMELVDPDFDRWATTFTPSSTGEWRFRVEAWSDVGHAWREGIVAKIKAGQPGGSFRNDLELGARLLDKVAAFASGTTALAARSASVRLRDPNVVGHEWLANGEGRDLDEILRHESLREHTVSSEWFSVYVERSRARFGSWYELFPRSTGSRDETGEPLHGTFATAAEDLPRIAAMGFDVVYLAPIHPIGTIGRKGRNNSPTAMPGDPGCPWAIGSDAGGHDAINEELGTVDDFARFVDAAKELGMEVALEFALQCAPDHPWLTDHPEWFTVRPDGSIACAENPPRIWTDIHPLNFEGDPEGLYAEIRRVLSQWIDLGVRAFRIDNPHTKPVGFWHRLIWDLKSDHPDVIFLAEAFTRPLIQQGLSKIGFTQTYTYFMWRDSKEEITTFGEELVRDADFLRPNLFPSNHDVFPPSLHRQGRAMFEIRAALAATLSPSWGIYSGYEICENEPATVGGFVPANAEKYELRPRDFAAARAEGRSLEKWIAKLNGARRNLGALQQLRTLRFHEIANDALLAYSKTDPATNEAVLCVVSLDPDHRREGLLSLTPRDLGIEPESTRLLDVLSGEVRRWDAPIVLTLDPEEAVAAIYHIEDAVGRFV